MIIIHDDNVSYEEWCENLGRDPQDEENYISYCQWKSNSWGTPGNLFQNQFFINTIFSGGGSRDILFQLRGPQGGATLNL